MKILAIDQATRTGWAHSNGACGVWDFSIRKDESSGMRLIRFEAKLSLIFNGPGIDLIAFEAVTAGGGPRANFDAIKLATKLQAVIERFCEEKGIACCSFNLMAIKKHAIPEKGKKRDKAAMLAAAKVKWPDKEIIDDNVADALWILDLAQEDYMGVEGFSVSDIDQRFEHGCD